MPITKVASAARKAGVNQRLARGATNGGNKSGTKMLISDSESFERMSRSDNKGSYHKLSRASVAVASQSRKKKDQKGSPDLLLVPSRESSRNDT